MEIDFGQPVNVGGSLAFPDTTFSNQPINVPTETMTITGTTSSTSPSIDGSFGPFG